MARQWGSTDLHAIYRDSKGTSVPWAGAPTPDTHHQQSLRTGGTTRWSVWSVYPVKGHVTGVHNFVGETLEILPCKDSVGYPPLLGFFANKLVIVFRGRAFAALVVCKDLDWGHLVTVFAVSEKRLCKELGSELHSGLKQKMNYSHLLRVCTKPSSPPAVGLHHTNLQGSWLGETHSPFSQPCLPCTEVQSVQELDRNILSLSQCPCLSCSFGCYASFSCG